MAISHVFTNPVPDGTITSIVRPSDWNSAHNQYYTLSGNVLGASTVSGTNVVFQAGANVSLSGTGGTIVIQGTNTPQPTSYVSNVNGLSGAVSLAAGSSLSSSVNGSSITFGLASNITTALQSANSNYLTTQTVQTQASGNIAGSGFTSTTTAGTAVVGTQNSNGLSLGVPAYITTQTVQTQASGNIAGSGFSSTTTAGTAIVGTNNSNGLSLGVPAYLTTQSVQTQASGNIAGAGFSSTTTAGTAIVGTHNSNGLSLNVPAYLTTQSVQTQASGNIAGSGFTGVNATGTLNSNGLSLSVAPGGGGGAMYANLSGNTTGNTTASGSTLNFSGINITLSGTNNSQIAISAPAASGLSNGNNIAISSTGSTIGISAQAAAIGAGTQTATSGTVNFANSNGISFGMSGSNQITASYTVPLTTGLAGVGFTTATTAGTNVVGTLSTNGLSLGVPAYVTAGGGGGAMYANLSGNTSGNTTASGNTLNFSGINVTLSGTNNSQIAISAPATSSLSAGNNISLSSNGSTIGLSALAIGLNTAGTNITWTANSSGLSINAAGYAGTGFTSTTTAGTAVQGTLGTNGLNLAIPAYVTNAAGGGGIAAAAGTQTATSGTVNFANSNGITFGMSGSSQITASYTVPTVPTSYVSDVNGSSGQISLNVGSSLSSSTAGSSITFGLASNITTALQSAGNYLTTAAQSSASNLSIAVAATNNTGGGTATLASSISFTNANGLTFYTSAGNAIAASYTVPTQSVQTQASGNIAGTGFTSTTTAGTAVTAALGTNGLNMAIPAYLTTQSVQTQASGNIAGVGFTSTTTAGTAVVGTLSTNGLSLGVPAYLTAAAGGAIYANLSGATSGNTTASGNTLNLSGINITLSGTNNSQIAISAPATSGLSAGNNMSISSNGSTIGFSALAAAIGAGTQTATSGTVAFVNSNGVTFGMSNSSQITASFSQSVQTQASGNIAGAGFTSTTTTGTVIVGTNNSNGLSLGVPAYLTTQSVQTQASGNIARTGFTSTTTAGTVIVGTLNTGGLSLGVPAYLTTQTVQTQASGNIAGSGFTGVNATGTLNSNGLSLSVAAPGGGGAINVSAGTTSGNLQTIVFSNSNGVTFGLDGSTVTASVAGGGGVVASGYSPHGDYPLVVGQIGQGTLALDPDIFPDLTMNQIAIPINFTNASNSTGSFTVSNWVGLYSRNVSSISLAHSTSFSQGITFSGSSNSSVYQGWRNITYPWSTSISGGRYWIAQIMRTTTGGANCSFSQYLASQINTNFLGVFGVATNATAQLTLGQGFYSASTTALPGSIAFTQIQGSNSLAQRFPMVAFGFNTV